MSDDDGPPVTVDVERWLDVALQLADVADMISLAHFGGRVAARTKDDGSLVTAADTAVEAALRERLAVLAPDHAVLGEEEGGTIVSDVPTWVLDPIDATNNFLRGVPVYATLLSLVESGEPVVGVASAPAMGQRWDAAASLGARRNGVAAGVSDVADLSEAQVLHGGLDWWHARQRRWDLLGRLVDRSWRTRGFGDFWMHLLVAGGMADVAVEQDLKAWDIAAVQCIVTEAGGRMTAWDGSSSSLSSGQALTSNGVLHEQVARLLTEG
ncbi:MAG: histidinol phosphatase [Actinomycetota bacterium]|nr:histidinol phosphatase [Actinomycetota bacterium]